MNLKLMIDIAGDIYERLRIAEWTFAKSMPKYPHWYTLRKNWDDDFFCKIVFFIREFGYKEFFGNRLYTMFNFNGYKFWTMGALIKDTILINKAKVNYNSKYDLMSEKYDIYFGEKKYKDEEKKLFELLKEHLKNIKKDFLKLNELRLFISKEFGITQPVDRVLWISIDRIQANDYNPNSVAEKELKLLYLSIKNDGYTQPIVTIYDKEIDKYIIVDGFHRYYIMKSNEYIYNLNNGMLPIVVIEKEIKDRIASTIRHNRARGKHSVDGMGNIIFKMLENGSTEEEICNDLGMEADEIIKLKHITGFSKLFKDVEYQKSWESKRQVKLRLEYEKKEKIK